MLDYTGVPGSNPGAPGLSVIGTVSPANGRLMSTRPGKSRDFPRKTFNKNLKNNERSSRTFSTKKIFSYKIMRMFTNLIDYRNYDCMSKIDFTKNFFLQYKITHKINT